MYAQPDPRLTKRPVTRDRGEVDEWRSAASETFLRMTTVTPVAGERGRARSVLLAFNTVERLMKGDFFHCVTSRDVVAALETFDPSWAVVGLGTSNHAGRHGELFVDGTASEPRLLWADPEGTPAAVLGSIDDADPLPFVAAAVCDPEAGPLRWELTDGEPIHVAVADRCANANVGLAALRLRGELHDVTYQVMCHIPVGGVAQHRPAVARQAHENVGPWEALGVYAANPTIQAVVSHGVASVHLHARSGAPLHGGHLNRALAGASTVVEAWPIGELVVRIRDLDVAVYDERPS